MLERRAALAVVLVLGVASLVDAGSVDAQPYYYRTPYQGPPSYEPDYVVPYGAPRFATDGLPPYRIVRAVRLAGYLPISTPVRRGSAYVVVASAPGRGPVRVAVDAYAGEIVSVTPATIFRPDGGVAQDFPPPRNFVRGPEVRSPENYGPRGPEVHRPEYYGPEARRPEMHSPEVLGNPSANEPPPYRPNAALRSPPRESSPDRLANVPGANAPAANVPATRSNGKAERIPMPRPRPSGTPPRDTTAGAAPATQGTGSADGGTPMVLPLPVQPSGAGNTGPVKTGTVSDTARPDVAKPEAAKSATTKSETVLVPVAPLD